MRFRFGFDEKKSFQVMFCSASCARASLISWYSNSTSSELGSHSPWYLMRIWRAFSSLPLAMSHRGDSGQKKMSISW